MTIKEFKKLKSEASFVWEGKYPDVVKNANFNAKELNGKMISILVIEKETLRNDWNQDDL